MIAMKTKVSGVRIEQVDEAIFSVLYLGHCLDCTVCRDVCCSYGCSVDRQEEERILACAPQLEGRLGIPATEWFEAGMTSDPDYPSGEFTRTRVNRGKCVFYLHEVRGCALHRLAAEQGMDWRRLKPLVCGLFPVTWDKGRLFVSPFLTRLPCHSQGQPVFELMKDDLRAYFGDDFVAELERGRK